MCLNLIIENYLNQIKLYNWENKMIDKNRSLKRQYFPLDGDKDSNGYFATAVRYWERSSYFYVSLLFWFVV